MLEESCGFKRLVEPRKSVNKQIQAERRLCSLKCKDYRIEQARMEERMYQNQLRLRYGLEGIHSIRTDLPSPHQLAPRALNDNRPWTRPASAPADGSKYRVKPVNENGSWRTCDVNDWRYGVPSRNIYDVTMSANKYHAPRPAQAWVSCRASTSGHVSPVVQSARLLLDQREKTKNRPVASYNSQNDKNPAKIVTLKWPSGCFGSVRKRLQSESTSLVNSDFKSRKDNVPAIFITEVGAEGY